MRSIVLLGMLVILSGAGCAGEKGKDLYETAQFEEKQNNREHAQKLYEELVTKYPDTTLAKQAQERLTALKANR